METEATPLVTVFLAEFETHLAELWAGLHQDRSQAEVRLLSSEGRLTRAHAVFLCQSPVLASLLAASTEPEPVVQLAGVSEDDLHLLLDFLYLGTINISSSKVEQLLSLARGLEISPLENILTSCRAEQQTLLTTERKEVSQTYRGDFTSVQSWEEFQIVEINPKLQSIVLIDKDELYADFFPKHFWAETPIILSVNSDYIEAKDEVHKKEETREEVSNEEATKEEVLREEVTKAEELKETNGTTEEVLKEEVEKVETILKEEMSPSVSVSDLDIQDENTVETDVILKSDQGEHEGSDPDPDDKDVSNIKEEFEDFDEYEEDDDQDYEEEEIFETQDETQDLGELPTENTTEVNIKKKKTRGKRILPNLRSNKCPECDETFMNRRRVRKHYIRKHIGKRFQCKEEECNKKYLEAVHLRRHIRVEHQKLRFKCDYCESEFTENKSLRKHIAAIHENITVACDLCDHVTSSKSNLKHHHESVHEGIKYSCDKCDKQFSNKSYLHKHNRAAHEKIRYACRQCKNTYTHKNSLLLHVRAHHDKVKHVCDICHVKYNMRRNLMLHYRRKHSSVDNVWDLQNYKI